MLMECHSLVGFVQTTNTNCVFHGKLKFVVWSSCLICLYWKKIYIYIYSQLFSKFWICCNDVFKLILWFYQGHVGFVMKESSVVTQKEGDEEASVSKSLKAVEKFSEFTFWNWDRTPCMADKYQQALTWVEVSKVVRSFALHQCYSI